MTNELDLRKKLYWHFDQHCEQVGLPVEQRVDAFINYTRKPEHPEVPVYRAYLSRQTAENAAAKQCKRMLNHHLF
ncbi:MAG: hypothetical protein HY363_00415 [Candidatus Aenigmarchaeota archaeon]|nr:hypothetical protein [Candidatus Aenigmarchaeota archaeon]